MLYYHWVTIILGFVEGFALIISPCILPILPIMLAGSLTGSKKRPFGITMGFIVIFALVAFFSRQWVYYSGIDLNLLRHLSYGILLCLGLMMVSTFLTEQWSRLTQGLISVLPSRLHVSHQKDDFLSGFFFGGLVAVIWTPCAGPILAAAIVQVAIQQSTWVSFLTLLAFALGAAIPMLLIAFYSQQLMQAFHLLKTKGQLFRQLFGALIIVSVGFMMIQEKYNFTSTPRVQTSIPLAVTLQEGLWRPYPAPGISGISTWINTAPLTQSALKGHVVLVDFWTYSCINCIRSLPYLNAYYKRYKDQGLIIVGVHAPEFDFEKDPSNVARAVKLDGIQYPVALDNQFVTWRNFKNHYWPAHYLINQQGQVVYEHFGEGNDEILENNIRFLLGDRDLSKPTMMSHTHYAFTETPETYLGFARADSSNSPTGMIQDKTTLYAFPQQLGKDAWALHGFWQIIADKIRAIQTHAAIKIHFHARNVYVVMGHSTKKSIQINLQLDGKPLTVSNQGRAVSDSHIQVDHQSIYHVISLPHAEDGILELTADSPGLELYTFTFGS